jgi:hypothetical protein
MTDKRLDVRVYTLDARSSSVLTKTAFDFNSKRGRRRLIDHLLWALNTGKAVEIIRVSDDNE